MIPFTIGQIAAITGGTPDDVADLERGGDRPGGDRLPGARRRAGCSRRCPASAPTGTTSPPRRSATARWSCSAPARSASPAIIVPDVPAALAKLARALVDRLPGLTIVGITGSAGKTTTKDLLAQLVATLGPTVAPQNSFNNEIGHPLTVLRCDEQTRYLIAELSARGPGHIAALCQIAPPAYGAVLCVGNAHAGEFGTMEQIARGQVRAASRVASRRRRAAERRRSAGRGDGRAHRRQGRDLRPVRPGPTSGPARSSSTGSAGPGSR